MGSEIASDPDLAKAVAKNLGNRAAHAVLPITGAMRDKVREWATARAASAQGVHTTEGWGIAAAKAALTGASKVGAAPASAAGWKSIPDDSIIGMPGGKNFRGKDIKSLVRAAVAAQKNTIANAPQLEASTAPRYADKASGLAASVAGTTKGKRQTRNLARAKKAMKKG